MQTTEAHSIPTAMMNEQASGTNSGVFATSIRQAAVRQVTLEKYVKYIDELIYCLHES